MSIVMPGIKVNRPIRCNNPFSIDYHPGPLFAWDGLVKVRLDNRLCEFIDAKYGIRAGLCQVFKYLTPVSSGGHGYNTIAKFVAAYAPNDDPKAHNNEDSYCAALEKHLGVTRNTVLSVGIFLVPLVMGVAHEETGYELDKIWGADVLLEGISLGKQHCGIA